MQFVVEKVDQCSNFQDEIGTELHEKLLSLKAASKSGPS